MDETQHRDDRPPETEPTVSTGPAPQPPVPPSPVFMGAGAPPPAYQGPRGGYPLPALPPPQKVRRVGTFTMAFSLIAVGALLILRIFVPTLNWLMIARFSPVILIFLGIEMLVANLRFKEEKLRYDGLSIFLSLVLITVSLLAALIPQGIYYMVGNEQANHRLSAELEQESAHRLEQDGKLPVSEVDWYVDLQWSGVLGWGQDDSTLTAAGLRPEHYVRLTVNLPGGYTTPAAFAKDCAATLALLEDQVPHINTVDFVSLSRHDGSYEGDVYFGIWIGDYRFQGGTDAAELEKMVQTYYWDSADLYYMDEQAWLARPGPAAGDAPPADSSMAGEEEDGPADSQPDDLSEPEDSSLLAA